MQQSHRNMTRKIKLKKDGTPKKSGGARARAGRHNKENPRNYTISVSVSKHNQNNPNLRAALKRIVDREEKKLLKETN